MKRVRFLIPWLRSTGGVRRRTGEAMACFAMPYWLRFAAHCLNHTDAQNNRPDLVQLGQARGHVTRERSSG